MRLAAPLGLALAALAAPLVAWYVLRSRRPRVVVASTLLWRDADRPVAAAVPWQPFRPDRTFWLVLAALGVATLALARPAVPVAADLGDHTVLVVDASASMLADEGGVTRLELARQAAADLVADLGAGQSASVVEAAGTGRVVTSHAGDVAAVRRALADVRQSQSAADLTDAFTLAAALDQPGQDTVVHLFTDGAVPDAHRGAVPPNLRVHAVGGDRGNLAITRVEAVTTGGGTGQVFVAVRNFGVLPADARVTVAVDGVEVVRQPTSLAPRAAEDLVITVPTGTGRGVVEARVEPVARGTGGSAVDDALWLDDSARAVLAGSRHVDALVVGEASPFLLAALASVEGVDVRTATRVPDDLAGTDLLVVDRTAPGAAPGVPTIYVAPPEPPAGVALAPAVVRPAVTHQASDHPLLADVDLSGLAIARARPAASPALEGVVAGPDGAVVLAGRLDAAPVVYVAFDLAESNLPLKVAWPVLVANAVAWLTTPPAAAPLEVGDEATFTPPPGAEGVEVTAPSGRTLLLDTARPRVTVDEVGVWEASWAGGDAAAALPPPPPVPVNVPVGESDLARPAPLADAAGDRRGAAEPVGGERGERVFGRELLAAALGLLLADAALRHRDPGMRGRQRRRARTRARSRGGRP